MILTRTSHATGDLDPAVRWQRFARCTIGWKGDLYLPGHASGAATVAELAGALEQGRLAELIPLLHGVFGVFIHDSQAERWIVFGDNSGLYRIFHSESLVSTSFLELVRADPGAGGNIDDQAIIEFLAFGANVGRHTPLRHVSKLRRDEILVLDGRASPAVRLEPKSRLIDEVPDADHYLTYFRQLALALAERKVSVDVTGGFDSRVIACMLDRSGLPFECALSGVPGSTEAAAAERVATAIGRPLRFHVHDIAALETELPAVFVSGDGLTEIPRLHRDRQLCLERQARGIEVFLHGGGGEFYRDHYFIQDFPRYGSSRVDIPRFVRLRMMPIALPPVQLTPSAAGLLQACRTSLLERLATCRAATNNLTYDQIYFHYRAPEFYGATFSNYLNMGMDVEAPFLDSRMALAGMHLPPWQRAFSLWHRRTITAHCPTLAALPTTDGYTASSRRARLLAELSTYCRVQASRVGRKLTERYLGKALFYKVGELEADAAGYRQALRRSDLFGHALARLQRQGLVRDDIEPERIANPHVGRILTMGTLLRYIDGEPLGRPAATPT